MSDPDPSDGGPIEDLSDPVKRPVSNCSQFESAAISEDKKLFKELKKILENRSVILAEPSSRQSLKINNKSFRARIKNFLPTFIYKMVSRLKPIHKLKKIGAMIALVQQKNQMAWQRLGEGKAEGACNQALRKLQLECEQSQLWLDLLEGREQSRVTEGRARVVDCLKDCVAAEVTGDFKQADKAYVEAVHELKLSIIHENDLKIELQTPKVSSPLEGERKQFEKMLVDEALALEAYRLYGHNRQL
ncbi:hypothetical protein [Endozoicomonas sp. SCSIO W0465]|uniref:hypothetical protein n=1 Tax=Endozoicomonas sp. SCSIO W0465 TaxID=2918516 RepID=UPI002075A3B7|nr:hypothetical protein [Endozoicomonas sp. SCSIO W0465]USE36472.1 hypothetical protein MJO57_31405 [Endozoicomonas sp. SCSIO W0465]